MKTIKVSKIKATLDQDEIIEAVKQYMINECVFDSEFDDEIDQADKNGFKFFLTQSGEIAMSFEFGAETEEG